MTLNSRLTGVLEWLREGYPAGVPPKDYIPLLALLRTRLTEAEVHEVAQEVARADGESGDAGAAEDIGVRITKLTDALPDPEDVARVEARLVSHHGWPVE